jgi:hypothetical protein
MMKALKATPPIKKMAFIGSAEDYGDSCLDMYTGLPRIGAEMASPSGAVCVADVSGFIHIQ